MQMVPADMSFARTYVGVDLVDIDDLATLVEGSGTRFLRGNWTQDEIQYANGRFERLATRWAAKEAVAKALGVGIGTVRPIQIEVQASPGRPPALALSGAAAELAKSRGIDQWSLSLSHQSGIAIAVAFALGR